MFNFFKKAECEACKVLRDWVSSRDNEISSLRALLDAERSDRQASEQRYLRALRILPPETVVQGTMDSRRVTSRIDWPAEKAKLETEAAKVDAVVEKKRLYWSNKQEKDAPKLEQEISGPQPPEIDKEAFKRA